MTDTYFRVTDEGAAVEVDEGSGNAFHLGPVLRKYTAARLTVKPGRRGVTTIELSRLFDALGLLRSLRYDVACSNAAAEARLPPSELRYACFRLNRQAAAFGVRVPRPGTGIVTVPGLDELVAHVESAHAQQLDISRTLLAGGVCDFESLAELFTPSADLLDRGAATGLFGVPTAFRVRACYFSRGKSLFGTVSTFFAALECVVAVGARFAIVECRLPVAEFAGTRSVADGLENMVRLTDAMRAELSTRGELYARLATGASFVEYSPGAFLPSPKAGATRAAARARGGGRMMVDASAALAHGVHAARSEGDAAEAVRGVMKLMAQRERLAAAAPAADVGGEGQAAATAEEESLELLLLSAPLPPSLHWLTWPLVAGFSFSAKCWGAATVSGLREVSFNDDAFERLVLAPGRKALIRALVSSHSSGEAACTDVIAGKGEGTIFLLHGPPGCGKTLTAEAVAELLHKPLYVVSMGELGTTPEALEERLSEVLDLCVPWGALVLIDEAEMLLEARTRNDIVRNAMVCVMLRLLEYYSGILFLTTNRVHALDPAFQSRVQCALRYEALDASSRRAVWEDLLRRAGAAGAQLDAAALAQEHPLNGRQIKNVLQLALALSRHEGAPLAQRHLEATLEVTAAFVAEATAQL